MNRARLLQRFLRYVQVATTADDASTTSPSSPGQLQLGEMVVEELRGCGLQDVQQDAHGIVLATIPATLARPVPVVAFNAHFDTSPETRGDGVRPQVIERYAGGDIVLPGDSSKVITVAQCPALRDLHGHTLITTDGTTLLGGDDKAGVAIMVELAHYLQEHPEIEHGPIRLLFTCDEEIGKGPARVDLQQVGAAVGYTLDGGGQDGIDVETFSADLALVSIQGVNIHPSIAKDKMINAVRIAAAFLAGLPRECAPEQTADRDGFLHPYAIEGGVARVELKILLRSFQTEELNAFAALLRNQAAVTQREYPGAQIALEIRRQYRNMAEGLRTEPRAVDYACAAHRRLGREPKLGSIRGGTDGAQFTERGLPTPNLSSGQHNIHSPLEFASLDQMLAALQVAVEIVKRWAE